MLRDLEEAMDHLWQIVNDPRSRDTRGHAEEAYNLVAKCVDQLRQEDAAREADTISRSAQEADA